ncbi:DMT family transporter [Amylibacter sp.]|nr:DMT family transporter [Amylibacter sp.]MDC1292879.1 DMT family transporter [Amylibacter sp.]MDC1531165.1 DMT family transporter [Amylibacter sp.]
MFNSFSTTIQAAIWMTGTIVSFSAMAVSGREISFELDTFEIMMYRSIIGLIIVLLLAKLFKTHREISTQNLSLHFYRNLSHFTGQNLWFYALTLIPFAQLFAFEFSVPLWVMLAAPFLLGERLTNIRIISILVGFIGILIVTRPWLAGLAPGIIPAALCAIGFACSVIFTKQLTQKVSITCILFWLTSMQLLMAVICAGYDGDISLPSSSNFIWIIIIGIGGLLAHFCITKALQLAPATVVTPIDFCRLPVIAAVGYMFYNEALDIFIIGGAIIIFIANYINIWSETKKG